MAIVLILLLGAGIAIVRSIDLRRGLRRECVQTSNEVRQIVTIVHGTWPRGFLGLSHEIEWYRPEAALIKALASRPGTLIHKFRWSGANSMRARFAAAEGLASEVDELFQRYGRVPHGIVAHSHGGNVALMALRRDAALSKRCEGLVSLSTPFISVSEQNYGGGFQISLANKFRELVVTSAGLALFFSPVGERFFSSLAVPVRLRWGLVWAWLVGVAGMFLIDALKTLSRGYQPKGRFVNARVRELLEQFSIPLPKNRLLIVRSVSDEASLALGFGECWAWGAQRLELVGVCLFGAAVVGVLIGEAADVFLPGLSFDDSTNELILLALAYGLSAIAICQLLRIGLAVPFGFRPLMATLFLDVSVEAAPPGTWTILQAPPTPGTGLNHSRTWQSSELVESALQWLFEKLSGSEGPER